MGPVSNGGQAVAQPSVQSVAPTHHVGPNGMTPGSILAPLLPGITLATGLDNYNPMLSLISAEKQGKSATTITSLVGYPEPHHQPLVLAWDEHGPDACVKLGYIAHAIRMRSQPGATNIEKARYTLRTMEANKSAYLQQYGSIVVDCASVCATLFHEDAKGTPKNRNNPDPRAPYFELALYFKEFVQRVIDFGLPSIWLAWQADGSIGNEDKKERQELGGPDIMGKKLRNYLAGRAHHNFILEKRKVGSGADPWGRPADGEGCIRVFHSQPWNMVNAGGRYSHLLPEPSPPSFSWILGQITGRGQYGARR